MLQSQNGRRFRAGTGLRARSTRSRSGDATHRRDQEGHREGHRTRQALRDDLADLVNRRTPRLYRFEDDGKTPNNPRLPLVL